MAYMARKLDEDTVKSVAALLTMHDTYPHSPIGHEIMATAGLIYPIDMGYDDLSEISRAQQSARIALAIEAFETTPAIKHYMRSQIGQRGQSEPRRFDMSGFAKAAQSTRDQYGKPRKAYQADPTCPLRLHLKDAVSFSYTQEAYADYSTHLVPVTGDLPAGLGPCQRNLAAFFRYADTHTGMAGSGANWSASLEVNEHGAFAIVSCRASISD